MSFEKDAKKAATIALITDLDGHMTGACEESYVQGAYFGALAMIEELYSKAARQHWFIEMSPIDWAAWLKSRLTEKKRNEKTQQSS